jgi:hypothetical protein
MTSSPGDAPSYYHEKRNKIARHIDIQTEDFVWFYIGRVPEGQASNLSPLAARRTRPL